MGVLRALGGTGGATLARLLARHGFQVRDVRAVPVVRSVRQTLYSIVALRMGHPALYQRLERLVPPTLGFPSTPTTSSR